ncbi:MAG: TetR/AcrR family transcriptional regulator [Leuconostoc fallax]
MEHAKQVEQTKIKIKKAFIQLIHEKGMTALTVSDITRIAEINRGTFYTHYVDKYDLLSSIENHLYHNIQQAMHEELTAYSSWSHDEIQNILSSPYNVFIQALGYIDSERETFQAILSDNGDQNFINQIKALIDLEMTEGLHKRHGNYSDIMPLDYTKEIILSSLINTVTHWLRKPNPESPQIVADILLKSRFLSPQQLLVFPESNQRNNHD